MARHRTTPRRRRIFIGTEGESERSFAAWLKQLCDGVATPRVHLDISLGHGGDGLRVVEDAVVDYRKRSTRRRTLPTENSRTRWSCLTPIGWRTIGGTAATPRTPCAERICDSSFSGRTSKASWRGSTVATRHDSFRHEMRQELSAPSGRITGSRPPPTNLEGGSGLTICDALPSSMPTCGRFL